MLFGMPSTPKNFQEAIEKILKGIKGVICLMDDILVSWKTAEEHWDKLREVLG